MSMRSAILAVLCLTSAITACHARAGDCGQVVAIETHDGTTMRYALAYPRAASAAGEPIVLVLLAGGGGRLDLGDNGCPRLLAGNSLVRSIPHFHDLGFITALVDAPSDHRDEDGLGGFRVDVRHAEDLGKVIADVRTRTKAAIWLAGTSRGAISAANAASRLSGVLAPDGLVLTSAVTSGNSSGKKAWVAQTVFDLPLESIRQPLLVVGHVADACIRSPAKLMADLVAQTRSSRLQVVAVSGGPGGSGSSGVAACEARTPHGFVEQEAEVAAGMARFIRGGSY